MRNCELPDKLSELIDVALADLEKVEADPLYEVDMGEWHQPRGPKCSVCFAGSVMAKTCDVDPMENQDPYGFSPRNIVKFLALNEARSGYVRTALHQLGHGYDVLGGLPTYSVVEYRIDPEMFKSGMRLISQQLKEKGL